MTDPGRVLIIGAGPTGLGAAYRLHELGVGDFIVIEAEATPGGLAASYVDSQGFTWDMGGHVQFSHYAYYDRVLDQALGGRWLWHERESWIRIKIASCHIRSRTTFTGSTRPTAMTRWPDWSRPGRCGRGRAGQLISPPGSIRPSAAASRGCSCIPTT